MDGRRGGGDCSGGSVQSGSGGRGVAREGILYSVYVSVTDQSDRHTMGSGASGEERVAVVVAAAAAATGREPKPWPGVYERDGK